MLALRKYKHVTRKASRFSSQKLRSHWNLNAYKSAKRGLQYNPYKERSLWRYAPLFHDSSRLVDPVVRLTGFTPGELEDRYDSLPDVVAEGFPDFRRFAFQPFSFERDTSQSIARTPARIRGTKYLVAPPSPVVSPAGVHNQYLQFDSPRQVLICVRRKQRREVLFAFNRAGGGHKRPKWREDSYIRC